MTATVYETSSEHGGRVEEQQADGGARGRAHRVVSWAAGV